MYMFDPMERHRCRRRRRDMDMETAETDFEKIKSVSERVPKTPQRSLLFTAGKGSLLLLLLASTLTEGAVPARVKRGPKRGHGVKVDERESGSGSGMGLYGFAALGIGIAAAGGTYRATQHRGSSLSWSTSSAISREQQQSGIPDPGFTWEEGVERVDPKGMSYVEAYDRFVVSFFGFTWIAFLGEFVSSAYIYKIYDEVGLGLDKIARLYAVSLVATLVAGLFAGAAIDKYGRRWGSMTYAVLQATQCLLLRLGGSDGKGLFALTLGRMLSGIASAFLWISPESWMVTEHHARGFRREALPKMLSKYVAFAGAAAVAAGPIAVWLVDKGWGLMAPFDVAAGLAIAAVVVAKLTWRENYGQRDLSTLEVSRSALTRIMDDGALRALGTTQALFEGCLLSFIVLWAPCISTDTSINIGWAFTMLMAANVLGNFVYRLLSSARFVKLSPRAAVVWASTLGSFSLLLCAGRGISERALLAWFTVYEACAGAYFVAMGSLRSSLVSDSIRGSVSSLFRVGVSIIGGAMLLGPMNQKRWSLDLKRPVVFGTCSAMLVGAAIAASSPALTRKIEEDEKTF